MEKWVLIDWDAELPRNPYEDAINAVGYTQYDLGKFYGYSKAKQDMIAAGFRKVRSEGGN